MLGRPLSACFAALLLFSGCSGGSSAQPAPAQVPDVSTSSTAAEAPVAPPSESTAAAAAELAFADTICAKPEMAELLGKTKSKASTTAGSVSVDGADTGLPPILNCRFGFDVTIGTALASFSAKEFKELRDGGFGTKKANAGDLAFTSDTGSATYGFALKGDKLVRAVFPGNSALRGDRKTLEKFLATAADLGSQQAQPVVSVAPEPCAAGLGAATAALKSAPPVQWGRASETGLACVWSTDTSSLSFSGYTAEDNEVEAEGDGDELVSGVGKSAVWSKWSRLLQVQVDASHGALVSTAEELGKAEAVSLYQAMEDAFVQFAKA